MNRRGVVETGEPLISDAARKRAVQRAFSGPDPINNIFLPIVAVGAVFSPDRTFELHVIIFNLGFFT